MSAEATLSLINLYLYLKGSQHMLESSDIEKLMPYVDRVFSDYYFDKFCAIDTLLTIYQIHGKTLPKPTKSLIEKIKIK
jgi:hypothetical protein